MTFQIPGDQGKRGTLDHGTEREDHRLPTRMRRWRRRTMAGMIEAGKETEVDGHVVTETEVETPTEEHEQVEEGGTVNVISHFSSRFDLSFT